MSRSLAQGFRTFGGLGSAPIPGLVLALVAVVVAGCGGQQADGGHGAGAAGEPAGHGGGLIAAEKVANCAGFTSDAAAEFLGVPAAEIEDHSQDVYDKLRTCSFVSSRAGSNLVGFSLRRDDSVEEAADEMDVFRSHLGVAQGTPAGDASGAPYEEVPGLGDEALWARANGTLNVRLGNVTIQVELPADREVQKKIAERVIAGLG
jgi:hypothetical protein